MENSPVVGIDGTHSTCDGEPMVCHIVGNEVFTTMTTTEHKDRVTVIGVLAGEPVGHCVGDHALADPELGVAAHGVVVQRVEPCDLRLVGARSHEHAAADLVECAQRGRASDARVQERVEAREVVRAPRRVGDLRARARRQPWWWGWWRRRWTRRRWRWRT